MCVCVCVCVCFVVPLHATYPGNAVCMHVRFNARMERVHILLCGSACVDGCVAHTDRFLHARGSGHGGDCSSLKCTYGHYEESGAYVQLVVKWCHSMHLGPRLHVDLTLL
jgi:hypothetical protein